MAILSPLLALLLVLTSVLPVLEAGAAMPMSAALQGMTAAADCPMHDSGQENIPAKNCCFCILCVTGSLAASPGDDYSVIPVRLAQAAFSHFATGVSATHGPRWTANPPTGPPAA